MNETILEKYNQFLDEFPQEWENLSGLAYTPLRYFYLADIQMKGFSTALEAEFIEFHKPTPKDYSAQCYSYCYGFYTLARTCLEVSSKFSDAFQLKSFSAELKEYRDSVKNEVKKIIDIANDYIKHPAGNQDKVTWYEPAGLDNSGEVSVYEWSSTNNEHFVVLRVKPLNDHTIVFKHLEELANLYLKQLAIYKNEGRDNQ